MNYLNWDMQFMLGLSTAARLATKQCIFSFQKPSQNANGMIHHCSIRVSNELGASHPRIAKFSVFVVSGTSILVSVIFCSIILIFRVTLSKLFTSDSEVIEAVSHLTPLLAISVFLNGIQPILSGNKAIKSAQAQAQTLVYPFYG